LKLKFLLYLIPLEIYARNTWTNELKQRYQLDYKAKPILICSLSEEGIAKVYALSSAKEI